MSRQNVAPIAPVRGRATTQTTVAVALADTALLPENLERKSLIVQNTGGNNIWVSLSGAAATLGTNGEVKLLPDGSLLLDAVVTTGAVQAIADGGASQASGIEVT